jgi:hypothetical protein
LGKALPPSTYAQEGAAAKGNPINLALDAFDFKRGQPLDAQPLATGTVQQRAAYGNYVLGVYMQAAGFPLTKTLTAANTYAYASRAKYTENNGPMDSTYTSIPAANVTNITNGFNAQAMEAHAAINTSGKRTRMKTFFRKKSAIRVLLLMVICIVVGCKNSQNVWSVQVKSPDGKMVATAKTSDESGPGTDFVQTTVYLNWTSNKNSPTMILAFSDGPSGSDGMKVWLNWLTSNHLEVDYKGKRNFDFQAIKFGPVDISVRDLSSSANANSPKQ